MSFLYSIVSFWDKVLQPVWMGGGHRIGNLGNGSSLVLPRPWCLLHMIRDIWVYIRRPGFPEIDQAWNVERKNCHIW